eukprot:TRINITY_DN10830_c0_g1_i1.p1 TRINITY_DN10830_c0_g1~~TRINITY_DN10830_c0_g1_i1.p1  ORF type:complete len:540 (+),score=67.71 TRINITY_DN10830_c0_g1_i1:50-1669(+)
MIKTPESEAPRPLSDVVTLDKNNEQIRKEILMMIYQYLQDEGYETTAHTFRAESKLFESSSDNRRSNFRKMKPLILKGEWEEVNRLLARPGLASLKALQYDVAKQQFLEHIEHGEGHKAFSIMRKKLKQLESRAPPSEFHALTYLLSCKSVKEAPDSLFEGWREESGREKLVSQYKYFLDSDKPPTSNCSKIPSNRLWTLLQQACGYQVLTQKHKPLEKPVVTSIAYDYEAAVCPNVEEVCLRMSTQVKCCSWLGGSKIVCGGNSVITVCDVDCPESEPATLDGIDGRVWTLSSSTPGRIISGGADGIIRIWKETEETWKCESTIAAHSGDVYTVAEHPNGRHLASGGFDCTARMFDIHTSQEVQTFIGHARPITSSRFNHFGNILLTGSKDGTIRFWEIASGVCLQTIAQLQTGAAVSSLDLNPSGTMLLVGYQDSSNRLWDLTPSGEPIQHSRLQGHINTSKNLVKVIFAPGNYIFGGSEDGTVCIWSKSGVLLSRLIHASSATPHPVYDVRWNQLTARLATCSDDQFVRIWKYDPS